MQPAQPLDYRGHRHGRMTRSMVRGLSKIQRLVLLELRYRLRDGETKHISQYDLSKATRLSEASVSTAMRQLAGQSVTIKGVVHEPPARAFIRRERVDDTGNGRPGYLITMLPPPEQRTTAAPPPEATPCPRESEGLQLTLWDLAGSSSDREDVTPEALTEGITPPDQEVTQGSPDDPSIFLYTHTDQEEGSRSTPIEKTATNALRAFLLSEPTMDRNLALSISGTDAIGTLEDFRIDMVAATELGKQRPLYYVAACWRNGRRVYLPEASNVRSNRTSRPDSGRSRSTGSGGGGGYRPGAAGGNRASHGRRAQADPRDRYARWRSEYAALCAAEGLDTDAA